MDVPDGSEWSVPLVVHRDGRIAYANAPAERMFGSRSLVNESILGVVAAAHRDALSAQFRRVRAGEASALGMTVQFAEESGATEAVALSTPTEWDGEAHVLTQFIDTGETLPSGLPAAAMDASPVGISIADATLEDLPLIYVNDGFVELTGYDREEALGQNCRFLQGEATNSEAVASVREAIEAAEPVTVELRNYRKDGSMFWNRLSLAPVENERGEVTHVLGFQKDVSERKAREHERALFEVGAMAVEQVVFVTDREGTIEYVNPQFERTTGYSAEEAVGENPRILKSDAQDESFYADLWETITAGEVWEAELTNRRKSGERYRTTQRIVPITDDRGEITHFVAVEQDITDAQFIEQVLDVMNRVLRHNVRNSVATIDGYADLLEGELDDEEHRAAVRTIREHATKLEKLSEETRAIRELFRRRNTQHSLGAGAIRGFVDRRREAHPAAEIDLSMAVEEDVEIPNGSLLQIAIDEAIENAVIHSDRAEPRVEVRVEPGESAEEVTIAIADGGPGIPRVEWDAIAAGKETDLVHGSGIGLWLMYWTVTALGGAMTLTDNEPRGSVVTFRVPVGERDRLEAWNSSGE